MPVLQFLACNFAIAHGGANMGIPETLLQHPSNVCGVVTTHSHNSKTIPQSVRTYVMNSSGLGIYKLWQACFFSANTDYLPTAMPVYSKDKQLTFLGYRAATSNIFPKHAQSVTIYPQLPLATTFLLLSLSLLDLVPTLRAKCMTSAKYLSAPSTGQL